MMLEFQKPWCLIDQIEVSQDEIKSQKYVSYSDFFLQGHFKEYSIFPGMLVVEGMLQSLKAANKFKELSIYNLSPSKIQSRFLHSIYPGDIISYSITVEYIDYEQVIFKSFGKVNQITVAKAKFIFRRGVCHDN